MTARETRGQALVEAAATLPIVLILLAGLYVACRTAFLASGAQSAAQAEALRAGRGLPGIEKNLAAGLLPDGRGVSIRGACDRESRLLPPPFPALAGRSSGTVSLSKSWSETGAVGQFSPLALDRKSVVTADCWGEGSASGKSIARTIRARIALGVLQ